MYSATITSAGGDSPKINRITAIDINTEDFQNIFEMEIRRIAEEHLRDIKQQDSFGETQTELGSGLGISASDITSILTNPTSVAARAILAAAMPIVAPAAVLAAKEAVIEELTRPGGLLDTRWKRDAPAEINAFLTRMQQQNTRIGDRQIIIQSSPGFSNRGGFAHDSILKRISENRGDAYRTSGIGLEDRAAGVTP